MKLKNIFNPKNLLRSLKVMAVSIVVGIPMYLLSFLYTKLPVVTMILGLIYLVAYLFVFGHLLNKWWGFK